MPEWLGYFTFYGGFRVNPYREVENPMLFKFYHDFFKRLSGKQHPEGRYKDFRIAEKFLTLTKRDSNIFQDNIYEDTPGHFSRDDMWAYYMLCLFYNISIEDLPVLKWNCSKKKPGKPVRWYHPNGWSVLLALKSKYHGNSFLYYLLNPLNKLLFNWSNIFDDWLNPADTDGNCLWCCMKYFLWEDLPNEEDIWAFRAYITEHGYWKGTRGFEVSEHPLLEYINVYENNMRLL